MALTEGWNGSPAPQAPKTPVDLGCGYACGLGLVLLSLRAQSPTIPVAWVVIMDLCWLQNNRLRSQSEFKCNITNAKAGIVPSPGAELPVQTWWAPVKYLITIR